MSQRKTRLNCSTQSSASASGARNDWPAGCAPKSMTDVTDVMKLDIDDESLADCRRKVSKFGIYGVFEEASSPEPAPPAPPRVSVRLLCQTPAETAAAPATLAPVAKPTAAAEPTSARSATMGQSRGHFSIFALSSSSTEPRTDQ